MTCIISASSVQTRPVLGLHTWKQHWTCCSNHRLEP